MGSNPRESGWNKLLSMAKIKVKFTNQRWKQDSFWVLTCWSLVLIGPLIPVLAHICLCVCVHAPPLSSPKKKAKARIDLALGKSILNIHWKDWCWSWNSNTLATWCKELTHLKRPWCWERLKAAGEGDDRGWDGWMASPINGHEFGWTPGVGDGQGGLVCCGPWGHEESDTTEQLNWRVFYSLLWSTQSTALV